MINFFRRETIFILIKRTGIIFLLVILVLFALNLLFPLKIKQDYSTVVVSAEGTVLSSYLNSKDKWRMYATLPEITPELSKAVLFKEDRYFYYHPGFNPLAMVRAAINNTRKQKRTSGASTITMQLARLISPAERTYANKIAEVFRAMQLELKYSKKEILQLYLNHVPYGGNVEGIKSASVLYFRKNPDHLSLAEIAVLAIVPNRPGSLRPGSNQELLLNERNRWLERFAKAGLFPQEQLTDAMLEPMNIQRVNSPDEAPQLCLRLKRSYPGKPLIHSSINRNKQLKTQQIVKNYVARKKLLNISNASVFVINNETGLVEVYAGSADFEDKTSYGQVDGVRAVRSPGSTLKPFLYATGFDLGLVTPKSIMNDVSTSFNDYAPENYDKKFHGKVTVDYALSHSLNLPAVKLLNEMGVPAFVAKFRKAGFKTIMKKEKEMGLSMILGGCGVTLEELTTLYSCLAAGGNLRKPGFVIGEKANPSMSLFSEEAAYMTTEILSQISRPDLPFNYQSSYHVPRVAWKTGTSYGRRDAWSVGYNRKYTIGVWVGNFSGHGVPELSGAEMATPLLFEIFNTLDYNSPAKWFTPSRKTDFRLVCSETGDLPDEYCQGTVIDCFIPGVSKTNKCQHMKHMFVDEKQKISYCRSCLPESGFKRAIFPNHSPDLISFYEEKHILYLKTPPHNPDCDRIFDKSAPEIISPLDESEYLLEKDGDQKLMLKCHAHNEVKQVFWYINDKLFKKSSPHQPVFFTPSPGKIKISCSDDQGKNTDVHIEVKLL